MQRAIIVFILSLVCFQTKADILISGNVFNNNNITKVALYKITVNEVTLLDSTIIADNKFKFYIPNAIVTGEYRILFNGNMPFNLILNDKKNIDLTIDISNLADSNNYKFNKENIAYQRFQAISNTSKVKEMLIWKEKENIVRSAINSDDKINNLKSEYQSMLQYIDEETAKIKKEFPNTYTSNVLTNLIKSPQINPQETGAEFIKKMDEVRFEHFFDTWSFKNGNIINNYLISDRLQYYFFRICHSDAASLCKGVDVLMSNANMTSDPEIKEYITTFLIKHFVRFGPPDVAVYIADNYLEGCSTLPISKETIERIDKMRKVVIGQQYVDLVGMSTNGEELKLSSYIGKNVILLLFWSSGCSHCIEEMPRIKPIYDNYKSKGFEIVAFSLDINADNWKQAIEKYQLNWVNMTDLKSFNSPNALNYFVNRTPMSILIGKDGSIIAKNKWESDLIIELNKLLK